MNALIRKAGVSTAPRRTGTNGKRLLSLVGTPTSYRAGREFPPATQTDPERVPADDRAPSSAGLIVITGPPLSGKRALGNYLNQFLPDSVHLCQADPVVADLRDEDPESMRALLRKIRNDLRCGHKVVFSACLNTPLQRARVLDIAREVGVPKLLVEVEGTDPDAFERVTEIAETLEEVRAAIKELKELLPRYRSISERKPPRVATVTVCADQPVEDQVKSVLDGWGQLGAVH